MIENDKLWFKRKRWGYGWSPNTKEGWLVTASYLLILVILTMFFISQDELNVIFSLFVGAGAIVTTVIFFFITLRHAPVPKWQWGGSKKGDK